MMAKGQELAMEIRAEVVSWGYLHVYASVVEYDAPNLRWVRADANPKAWHRVFYPDVTSQANGRDSLSPDETYALYAWTVQYTDAGYVNLGVAREMVKVLQRIERGMERHRLKFGAPDTYAEYVLRVADVLKITKFVIEGRGHDAAYARSWIARQELDWVAKHTPRKASPAALPKGEWQQPTTRV